MLRLPMDKKVTFRHCHLPATEADIACSTALTLSQRYSALVLVVRSILKVNLELLK